jgi:CheY-like chemotaxis protein
MASTPPPAPDPNAAGRAEARPAIRVLVVDDDPLSCSFLTHLLSLLGHHALAQGDAEQALVQAASGEFDLLLLDLGMPGLDGFEVLRRLRDHEAQAQRPALAVVAVTGYASDVDRMRCLAAGFSEHLAKPIQAASLSSTLDRVLGARAEGAEPASSDVARLRATVKRLNETRPGDRGFAPTVTESFALRSAQLLDTLRRGVQQRDPTGLPRAAQALKASAEFLGALRLARMCGDLEQRVAQGDWAAAESLLGLLNNEHQVVLTLLFESAGR